MGSNKKKKGKSKKSKLQVECEPGQNIEENESQEVINKEEIQEIKTMKRPHEDDGSESESDKPKKAKKKKKKQSEAPVEPGGKKNKKSIRQIKKEKYAQRQAEAQAAAKDQLKSQCLSYLSQWKHDKPNWKFMKAKQVWLYKNKFSIQLVPDESWPLLLEYFESAVGNIKNMLLEDAHKIIKQLDEWTESQNKEENADEETSNATKPDENVYNRARSLIQCLQE